MLYTVLTVLYIKYYFIVISFFLNFRNRSEHHQEGVRQHGPGESYEDLRNRFLHGRRGHKDLPLLQEWLQLRKFLGYILLVWLG
jgi:hypothetical protein